LILLLFVDIEPIVSFSQSRYSVEEDNGPVQPVLILSEPLSTDVTLQVLGADGTATGEQQ